VLDVVRARFVFRRFKNDGLTVNQQVKKMGKNLLPLPKPLTPAQKDHFRGERSVSPSLDSSTKNSKNLPSPRTSSAMSLPWAGASYS
jgi:hypothetical protein